MATTPPTETQLEVLRARQEVLLRELHLARLEVIEHEALLKTVDAWRTRWVPAGGADERELLDLLATADNSQLATWDRQKRVEVLQEAVNAVLAVIDDEVIASPAYQLQAHIFEQAIQRAATRLAVLRDGVARNGR